MKNTLLVCALALSALSFPSFAQEGKEVEWYNVTALNFVATGGKDQSHALQQYLLFDRKVQYENQDLFARYQTFAEEYMQRASAGSSSVVDETIAEFRKILKEHPEMAEQLNESIKELEASKSQMESNGSTSYSYDPAVLLKQLTSIAINRKVYTGYKDIGGGLFAVKTGACYGPLDPNAFSPVQTDAQNEYTWGIAETLSWDSSIRTLTNTVRNMTLSSSRERRKTGQSVPARADMTGGCAFRSNTISGPTWA